MEEENIGTAPHGEKDACSGEDKREDDLLAAVMVHTCRC